jgi:hypothetical protein
MLRVESCWLMMRTMFKVAMLESHKTELRTQLVTAKVKEGEVEHLDEQRAQLANFEREVAPLRGEKGCWPCCSKECPELLSQGHPIINLLNQAVNVYREHVELAQAMIPVKNCTDIVSSTE